MFYRCRGAYAFDHATARWHAGGRADALPSPDQLCAAPRPRPFALGALAEDPARDRYLHAVRAALAYIRAGDVYQVNLAHRLRTIFTGSGRAFFAALVDAADPWHACYLESDDGPTRRIIASASPELFLDFEPRTRTVITRPMKGTRRGDASPAELEHAEKDQAELNMIVDLMRNDLGRVCDFGTVRVDVPRAIERHGSGLLQATATVTGRLSDDRTLADLIGAAFPPGSVTGAPKIRAMQIIEELESFDRGPWCGALGFVADSGHARFNVAIRTATITGAAAPDARDALADARLDWPVGAGIVADSCPEDEWQETLDKAQVLGRLGLGTAPALAAEPAR